MAQESQSPHAKQVPPSPLAGEKGTMLHQLDQAITQRGIKVVDPTLLENELGNTHRCGPGMTNELRQTCIGDTQALSTQKSKMQGETNQTHLFAK